MWVTGGTDRSVSFEAVVSRNFWVILYPSNGSPPLDTVLCIQRVGTQHTEFILVFPGLPAGAVPLDHQLCTALNQSL